MLVTRRDVWVTNEAVTDSLLFKSTNKIFHPKRYLAIQHFRYFLEGRPFTAFTDYKPLTFAFAKISDPWSARQQRHLSYVSEYTTDVQHVAGKATWWQTRSANQQSSPR